MAKTPAKQNIFFVLVLLVLLFLLLPSIFLNFFLSKELKKTKEGIRVLGVSLHGRKPVASLDYPRRNPAPSRQFGGTGAGVIDGDTLVL